MLKTLSNKQKKSPNVFWLMSFGYSIYSQRTICYPEQFSMFCFVTYNNDETKIIQLSNAAEKWKKKKNRNAKPWKSNLNSINFLHYSRNFITMFGIQQMKQQIMFNHFYFTDLNIIHSMPKTFPKQQIEWKIYIF